METSVNNKCRAFTSLEQSKKLAEILPLESADYHYIAQGEKSYFYPYSLSSDAVKDYDEEIKYIPCWSLVALLSVLPNNYVDVDDMIKHPNLMKTKDGLYMIIYSPSLYTSLYNDPVDACVAMIEKLNELNLL